MEPEDELIIEGSNTPVDNDHEKPQRCDVPLFGAEYGNFKKTFSHKNILSLFNLN
jgi:hypothetical protein